jgi:hypothetical protein
MKLIMKADLSMHDGLVLDKDGNVLCLLDLVDEVNEIIDLAELITFVKDNATAIEMKADGKFIKFTPAQTKAPIITSVDTKPTTPLTDEAQANATAIAEEFLNVRQYDDVNEHLKRYINIASFLDKDYILVDEGDGYCVIRFKTDLLVLTEDFVIATVKEYHDPAIRKLISGVVISR